MIHTGFFSRVKPETLKTGSRGTGNFQKVVPCMPNMSQTPLNFPGHNHKFLLPCDCTHAGLTCTPYGKLTSKHKEEVLMLVVRLNQSRGDSSMIAAVSKELMELDMGDMHELADVARHLVKCDYSADPAKQQIIIPI